MALFTELPLYKDCYDLLLKVYSLSKNFHRDTRYTIGEGLKREIFELVLLLYRANMASSKGEYLGVAREKIEVVRLMIRLLKDLKQIPLEPFVSLNELVEKISKQLLAWQRKSS
jgi:hypothetical protein